MFREYKSEHWTCDCLKFVAKHKQYYQDIWAYSPDKAAEKFAKSCNLRNGSLVDINDNRGGYKQFKIEVKNVVKYVALEQIDEENK